MSQTSESTFQAPVVFEQSGNVYTNSMSVATCFEKAHKNVVRDIEVLVADSPEDFGRLNFELTSYTDSCNRKQDLYNLTFDGFILLAMGYTGKDRNLIKIGQSKDGYKRAKSIVTHAGIVNHDIWVSDRTFDCAKVEHLAHKHFADNVIGSEWFAVQPDVAKEYIASIIHTPTDAEYSEAVKEDKANWQEKLNIISDAIHKFTWGINS